MLRSNYKVDDSEWAIFGLIGSSLANNCVGWWGGVQHSTPAG